MNERTIFLEALEQPTPDHRAAFLDLACGADTQLRQKVEALLQAHGDAGSFIEHPAYHPEATQRDLRHSRDTDSQAGQNGVEGSPPRPMEQTDIPLHFLSPSDVPAHLGKLGSYEILEVIGRGAFGIVLRALDPKLNRVVAIKVLAPELAGNVTSVKRFLKEAVAAAAVSHDHVVTIHAVEDSTALPYLVMECIIGQSLQQKIERSGPLPIEEVLRIGMQIAFGLAAAHKQGLVHRDIKPANILLENGVQRVKITDFGLARSLDDLAATQTFQVAGTPQYMSPEQAHGDSIDQRSDLFSLGSVMYAMCTGRPAFKAESVMGILRRVCDEVPQPIPEINPRIPYWLDDIVARLMAKRADDRYQTATEVAELLRDRLADVQQNREISSQPPKPPPFPLANYANSPRKPTNVPVLLAIFLAIAVVPAFCLVVGVLGYFFTALSVRPAPVSFPSEMRGITGDGIYTTVEREVDLGRWESLFNGTSLAEWQPNDYWKLEDGVLVSRVPPDIATSPPMLATIRNDFRDFHAKVEAKINQSGDSGLFFRFGEQGDKAIQAQITASPAGTGSLLRNTDTIVKSPRHVEPDEWFTLEVIAQGSLIKVIVDGTEVAQWIDRSSRIDAGPLAFESGFGGTEIAIRKVDVKMLPPLKVVPLQFEMYGDMSSAGSQVVFCTDRTPDGKTVIAGNAQGEVLIWRDGPDTPSHKVKGHQKSVYGIATFPDNRRAVSSAGDGTIQMWDLTTGQKAGPEFSPTQNGRVDQLLVTPDGSKIVTACVSYQQGTSADGRPAENAVRLWDCETGKMLREFPSVKGPIDGLALSPNGKRLLASDGWSDLLLLWNVETGDLLHSVYQPAVRRMVFSPDGNTFVAAHYPTDSPSTGSWDDGQNCVISFWDTDTLTRRKTFRGHTSPVCGMGFLSNGSQFVSLSSGAFDRQGRFHPPSDATMRLWDVASGTELWQYPIGEQSQALRVVGPQEVLTSGKDAVRLWTLPVENANAIQ